MILSPVHLFPPLRSVNLHALQSKLLFFTTCNCLYENDQFPQAPLPSNFTVFIGASGVGEVTNTASQLGFVCYANVRYKRL